MVQQFVLVLLTLETTMVIASKGSEAEMLSQESLGNVMRRYRLE